jgi:hypothetical protein
VYTPHERAAIIMNDVCGLIDAICQSDGDFCEKRLNAMVDQTIIEMIQESKTFDRADRLAIGLLSMVGLYLQGDELLQFSHPNDRGPAAPGSIEEMLKLLRKGKGGADGA